MSDTISDFITVIRNASRAGKEHCTGRYSRMHLSFARILKKEGYLREVVESNDENGHKAITLKLKYVGGLPAITGVQRWSKPGRRQYYRCAQIPRPQRLLSNWGGEGDETAPICQDCAYMGWDRVGRE